MPRCEAVKRDTLQCTKQGAEPAQIGQSMMMLCGIHRELYLDYWAQDMDTAEIRIRQGRDAARDMYPEVTCV